MKCKNCGHDEYMHDREDTKSFKTGCSEINFEINKICDCKQFIPEEKGCGKSISKDEDCGAFYDGKVHLCPSCSKEDLK